MKTYNAIGQEMPQCLCKQAYNFRPEKPRMKYAVTRHEYLLWCPTCNFRTHPDSNKQSVITEWFGANRAGDETVLRLWIRRHEEIQNK
jgi:hypothetical protein